MAKPRTAGIPAANGHQIPVAIQLIIVPHSMTSAARHTPGKIQMIFMRFRSSSKYRHLPPSLSSLGARIFLVSYSNRNSSGLRNFSGRVF